MKDLRNANKRHLNTTESTLKDIHPSGPFEENQDNIHSLIAPDPEVKNEDTKKEFEYYDKHTSLCE
ncbi:MAG TPA: hypothetical protein VK590_11705 [Saprospiraceae bacterium]|nr:hypothetical protein [Saprospiraceae bacterium]